MKKLLTIFSLAALIVSCGKSEQKAYNRGINIIPVPAEMTITDTTATFNLSSSTSIGVNSPDFQVPAEYLAAKIKAATGFDVKVGDAGNISLELNTRVPVNNEGYLLTSTKDGVTIQARTPEGAFYGVQTLLQLLPAEIESAELVKNVAWEIPLVEIKDEPRFAYRGYMLDVCRHFATVEEVKRQLDVLAMFKINQFHWHLTEDQGWRIEIKKYPRLTETGSVRTEGDGKQYGPFFYTQEQIKEVVAYAAKLYIDVVPEIEFPGHALAALTAYPEYSCTGGPFKQPRIIWGVEEDVYCVGNEKTFEFVEDVLSEVADLFPSKYFHIGGDECPKVRWKVCPKCQALAKSLGIKEKTDSLGVKHSVEEQLQSYAIQRAEKFLASKGKRMIGWDEILEGGLAEGAIVMSWRGEEGGIAAANANHQVIMTPGSGGLYVDHYQGAPEVEPAQIGGLATLEKTYAYNPIPKNLPEDKAQYILGAQCNMWTEYCTDASLMEYMAFPRIIALAEATWSKPSRKDWTDFSRRINNAYARLDFHNINYHIPMPEGILTQNVVFVGDSTVLEFTNTRNLPMVYTLDGSEPNGNSMVYTTPIVVTENTEVKIATLMQTGKTSRVRSIPVQKQTLAPAVAPTPNPEYENIARVEGLKPGEGSILRIAEGLFPTEADFSKAQFGAPKAVKHFWGEGSEHKAYDMNNPSLAVYEGYIELPEDGVYTFAADMDELWIDNERVIHNPTMARHYRTKAQKALAAGKHSYKIVFNNMIKDGWPNGWNEIGFRYKLPSGGNFQKVKPEQLTY